jgi:hypothetical protein
MLFEAEGTTFSDFLRRSRPTRAHQVLADRRNCDSNHQLNCLRGASATCPTSIGKVKLAIELERACVHGKRA